MLLENYFDFISDTCVRIRKSLIRIETVIEGYQNGASPEEILLQHPTLSLEEIHAAILYYLANQLHMEAYLERVAQQHENAYQKWLQDSEGGASDIVRALCAQRALFPKAIKREQMQPYETLLPA